MIRWWKNIRILTNEQVLLFNESENIKRAHKTRIFRNNILHQIYNDFNRNFLKGVRHFEFFTLDVYIKYYI